MSNLWYALYALAGQILLPLMAILGVAFSLYLLWLIWSQR